MGGSDFNLCTNLKYHIHINRTWQNIVQARQSDLQYKPTLLINKTFDISNCVFIGEQRTLNTFNRNKENNISGNNQSIKMMLRLEKFVVVTLFTKSKVRQIIHTVEFTINQHKGDSLTTATTIAIIIIII